MKKTEIYIKAFECHITLTLERKEYMTLKQCEQYVKNALEWRTATVLAVKHGEHLAYQVTETAPRNLFKMSGIARRYQRVA